MRAIVSRAGFRGPGGAHVRASRDTPPTDGGSGLGTAQCCRPPVSRCARASRIPPTRRNPSGARWRSVCGRSSREPVSMVRGWERPERPSATSPGPLCPHGSGRPGSLLTLAPHRSGRAGSAASGSSTDGFATRRRVPAGPGSQAMATAIPKACLASSAIRCRDVETGPNLGVLAVFPSTGATCRCPLPSTGSRGLNSPASAVL